jgi:hypothetical protein
MITGPARRWLARVVYTAEGTAAEEEEEEEKGDPTPLVPATAAAGSSKSETKDTTP